MLYSQSHNFVFVHIAKNGGTSIRAHLKPYSVHGKRRNVWVDTVSELPIRRDMAKIGHPPHVSARWVRTRLGAPAFDRAFSFAIVRNPFDQMVSRYEYVRQRPDHRRYNRAQSMSFLEYMRHQRRTNWNFSKSQFDNISDHQSRVLVSKIYRFEEPEQILPDICKNIGIEAPTEIPHLNATKRKPYQDYYDKPARQFVENLFSIDLDYFGYSFD